MRYWVCFSGKAEMPWLKVLRPGFRHCYLLMQDDHGSWLSLDPMLSHTMIQTYANVQADFDFPRFVQSQGDVIMPATADHSRKTPAPLRLLSCVETIKRILGIHKRGIVTPYQLYRYLKNNDESHNRKAD